MRPDLLASNALETDLLAMRRELDDIKGRQYVGSSSLLVKNNGLGPPLWDINGVAVADLTSKQWRVTFTPTVARDAYAELQFVQNVAGGNGFERLDFYPDTSDTSTTSRSWIFAISTSSNPITLSVKFYVKSIDSGVISVVAI